MRGYLISAVGALALVATGAAAQEPPGFGIVDSMVQMYFLSQNVSRLFVPGNDNLAPGPNNTFVGYRPSACNAADNYTNHLPNGFGHCVPDSQYPGFGAGLVYESGHTPQDCVMLQKLGGTAMQNKTLGTSGSPFDSIRITDLMDNNPASGVNFGQAGGVCMPSGAQLFSFVGGFQGGWAAWTNAFSDVACAMMVNLCGPSIWGCSCGLHVRPPSSSGQQFNRAA